MKHGKPKAPEIPRRISINYGLGWDLPQSIEARDYAQYGSINQPIVPLSRALEPPKYSVTAPIAASTPQSVARSREGTAADVDRYIAQMREARRRDSLLPTYNSSAPRSESVISSNQSTSILRKLFVFLLLTVGIFLIIAWWNCQLSVCK